MSPSMKKMMAYLGLVDDEYEEYDDYDERATRSAAPSSRPEMVAPEPVDERPAPQSLGRIRTLPGTPGPVNAAAPSPAATQAAGPRTASVRPVSGDPAAKVQVVAPQRFGDAKEIADCLKSSRPVIVNLQVADRDLQRRMIDFCSGVTYALSGDMEKVADEVFLLTPTNVKVSDEERQRLQERGLVRT